MRKAHLHTLFLCGGNPVPLPAPAKWPLACCKYTVRTIFYHWAILYQIHANTGDLEWHNVVSHRTSRASSAHRERRHDAGWIWWVHPWPQRLHQGHKEGLQQWEEGKGVIQQLRWVPELMRSMSQHMRFDAQHNVMVCPLPTCISK